MLNPSEVRLTLKNTVETVHVTITRKPTLANTRRWFVRVDFYHCTFMFISPNVASSASLSVEFLSGQGKVERRWLWGQK